jgi:hypothetical protein
MKEIENRKRKGFRTKKKRRQPNWADPGPNPAKPARASPASPRSPFPLCFSVFFFSALTRGPHQSGHVSVFLLQPKSRPSRRYSSHQFLLNPCPFQHLVMPIKCAAPSSPFPLWKFCQNAARPPGPNSNRSRRRRSTGHHRIQGCRHPRPFQTLSSFSSWTTGLPWPLT